jgi:DNA-3-methyladenine glycosylase II
MTALSPKDRLDSHEAVARHLQLLLALDPRLAAVHVVSGPFPPRTAPAGFAGLARIVCGQQVSVASADAIWNRLQALPEATTPAGFLALGKEGLKGAGLSRSKFATLTALARSMLSGELDLTRIESLPADEAIAALTRHKGIGPWTAEIYLMFSGGHPDIFPAGDLALQKAVGEAFGLDPYPDRRTLIDIAADWAPHRATAALLFWRFYAARRNREGLAL